ncbi:MAG TPA: hypothetical protein VM689_13510 [Aliidongia sp.]|nr:hypothetical protein [Aliidongia sp.]
MRPVAPTGADIAIEHVLWSAAQQLTPRETMAAFGVFWPAAKEPSWHDATLALSCTWRRLGCSHDRRAA